jgi:hypothetical protein
LINEKSTYWQAAANAAIAQASRVWGGRNFLLIPTDGHRIQGKFWEILEAYSPDYFAICEATFFDLKDTEPERYRVTEQRFRNDWETKGHSMERFEQWFADSAAQSRVDELTISEELDNELVRRLSPFHFKGAIDQHLTSASEFGYPFTQIAKITPHAVGRVREVFLPRPEEDPLLSLIIRSQTGIGSEEHCKELGEQGTSTTVIPDDYTSLDLLNDLFGGTPRTIYSSDGERVPVNGYLRTTPFAISMLHLGQYYRADRHQAYKEPVTVVLGDTVDDFCLYYSLSRVHEGIVWLPLAWLREYNASLSRRAKLREQGETPPPMPQQQKATSALIHLADGLIKYGHSDKRIQLCSMSLRQRQLIAHRSQMARAVGDTERFIAAIDCVPVTSVSTTCTLSVFEKDNYVNQQTMVFIDGRSVGPIETPRPKNFRVIKLPDHYWLTSLHIEGYQPPSLPTLGPKIVNIHNSTTESRVASDGIVYLCPNSMIFSDDLDAVIVRPKLQMPDVMTFFNTYFEDAGVSVRYSDKGNYFNDTVRRFGGLDETGQFIKSAATRGVLEKFMQKKGTDTGVFYLPNDQRSYLNLDALASSMGSREAAAELADGLVTKEILQRGYILRCERCSLTSWYGLDVLTATFVCNRCAFPQQFTRTHWKSGQVEPQWMYKLAETVYQFYENNSHLTAQVLYKLKSESKVAFHYAPEIDLIGFGGADKKREMDVACVLDGQIIFGECKTETLKLKDVTKFEMLARLPVQRPTEVIFATTQPVSEDFKNKASSLTNARIFTRSDLYDS